MKAMKSPIIFIIAAILMIVLPNRSTYQEDLLEVTVETACSNQPSGSIQLVLSTGQKADFGFHPEVIQYFVAKSIQADSKDAE